MGTGRTRTPMLPLGGARIHPLTAMDSRMMADGVKNGARRAMETPVRASEASPATFGEGSSEDASGRLVITLFICWRPGHIIWLDAAAITRSLRRLHIERCVSTLE